MFETAERVGALPAGLAELTPGPELARLLGGVDRDRLSGRERVELLRARARLRAHVEAEFLADLVSILSAEAEALGSELPLDELYDVAAAEIQAALTWTRRASETRLSFAAMMVNDYPQVWSALHAGMIDYPKAQVICGETAHLEPPVRDRVVETALTRAPSQSTGQLAARIRRLAIEVDPGTAEKRYRAGLEGRKVGSDANPDGTANLWGLQLSPSDSQAALRRINRLAKAAKKAGDCRTMDQIRADVFIDLLTGVGGDAGTVERAVVDIRVDLTTLMLLDDSPAEIPGWGPVIADIARQAVRDQRTAQWRYTVTGGNGEIVSNGTTRRRPGAGLRRRVEALNPECLFMTCRFPARDCDLDHNTPRSAKGPTREDNLGPFCRHHHVIRHHGWTVEQIAPGVYRLTSPLGVVYITRSRAP